MAPQKHYHYIAQAYQKRFADPNGRVAYLAPDGTTSVTNVRKVFGLNEGSNPMFLEHNITMFDNAFLRIIAKLDTDKSGTLKNRLARDGRIARLRLPPGMSTKDAVSHQMMIQILKEPDWRECYASALAAQQITHQQYSDQIARIGDPYNLAARAISNQYGLSVMVSTGSDFVFGSRMFTPLPNEEGWVAPIGRFRAIFLTASRTNRVMRASADEMLRYNRSIIADSICCATHPDNSQLLNENADSLNTDRQGNVTVQFNDPGTFWRLQQPFS